MKSRQFLEFVSSQFIANAVGIIDQCSIVVCNAVFRSKASTSFEFIVSYSLSYITYKEVPEIWGGFIWLMCFSCNCSQ